MAGPGVTDINGAGTCPTGEDADVADAEPTALWCPPNEAAGNAEPTELWCPPNEAAGNADEGISMSSSIVEAITVGSTSGTRGRGDAAEAPGKDSKDTESATEETDGDSGKALEVSMVETGEKQRGVVGR